VPTKTSPRNDEPRAAGNGGRARRMPVRFLSMSLPSAGFS
jgi:hypothetical protein